MKFLRVRVVFPSLSWPGLPKFDWLAAHRVGIVAACVEIRRQLGHA